MPDRVQVIGAVLDDAGNLSKLVVEQEDHTSREVLVVPEPSIDVVHGLVVAGSGATNGLVDGQLIDFAWAGGDESIALATPNENFWGANVNEQPLIVPSGVFGFAVGLIYAVAGAPLVSTKLNISLSGEYDETDNPGFSVDLPATAEYGVPIGGGNVISATGVTPWLPGNTEFIVSWTKDVNGGTVNLTLLQLSIWKIA